MRFMDKLLEQEEYIKQSLPIADNNFIGIFLYGSQNYHLEYEHSDVDSIVLVCSADNPKQEVSTSSGKIKIYTLNYFIYRLKKGDLECYEILYTKYKIINPLYKKSLAKFIQDFSGCVNYERLKYSLCIKLEEHLLHVFWIITKNEEKARYNKKRLYWAIRVCNQLGRLIDGEEFESSLIYRDTIGYDLMKIKTITNYLSPKDARKIYDYLVEFIRSQPYYSKDVSDEEEKCFSNFIKEV